MNPVPQPPFVPRQAGSTVVQAPRRRRGRFNVLSFISIVCFFGALILSVGVFLLKSNSMQTLEEKKKELSDKQGSFNNAEVDELRAFHDRLTAANYLLDSHIAPSVLFDFLERTTQEEIQYRNFTFGRRPSGNVSVSMQGVAPRFNTVASQAKRYLEDEKELFANVLFTNLNKPSSRYVTFQVDFDINKSAVTYDVAEAPIPVEETANDSAQNTDQSADQSTGLNTGQNTDQSTAVDTVKTASTGNTTKNTVTNNAPTSPLRQDNF
jgi:hypothetical protein